MHATHPRVASRTAALGFLLLFLLYQLPEASQFLFRNDYLFLALMLLMVVAAHGVARWQGFRGLAAFGLGRHPGYLRNLGLGLLPGLALPLASFFGAQALGLSRISYVPAPGQFLNAGLLFVVGTFVPSMAEDILTRGYVARHLGQRLSAQQFVWLSSGVYVLNHIYRLGSGPTTWVFLFVTGVALAVPLVLSGSLWFTVGLHWGMNIVYQLTNNVVRTETLPQAWNETWLLTACMLLTVPASWWLSRYAARPPAAQALVLRPLPTAQG